MSTDRIKEIFAEVADVAPEERAAAIDRHCDGDADLRARIMRLLTAHDAAGGGGFMAEPTAHPDTPPIGGEAGAEIGQTLGAFTLEKVIGEGGFGTVYLGRQEAPIQRCAAIKVLKPGMDSRQVIARFETERQTLAMMEHEGIAKVIDAGTTAAGRPFVAMEYVEGSYITDYCDQRRLSIEERLRLFERICLAVQHAHQKGVIHRDLKPSNILVAEIDGRPAPKIIDFGIAKALEAGQMGGGTRGSASRLTGGHQLLGTPEYMSPEQAAGGSDVDTRTDVYSLGVLLYELLCGAPPFDRQLLRKAGPAQLERILQEDRPGRPSGRIGPGREDLEQAAAARRTDPPRLRRQLKGDLDWIVMRALEKDPERRYPTAYALSADIRRALHHKPVEAGPPGFTYIAGKFLKRHRGPAAGIMVAALLILAALALAITGFWRASTEGQRAEVALEDAKRQLNVALVAQARAMRRSDAPGRRAASLDAIKRAAEYEVSAEMRSEAIATLALDDIRLMREIEVGPLATGLGLDRVDRVAVATESSPGEGGGAIRIISLETGEPIAELATPEGAQALLRFSPDGRYFAARFWRDRAESLRIWEVESGRIALAIEDFEPDALAFGGDWSGRPWVAVGRGDGRIEIYSLGGERGSEAELLGSMPVIPGWKNIVASRDGRLLAVNVYEELAVDLYRVEAGAPGELLGQFHAESPMLSLEMNDAADVLAAGCADFSIALWATAAPGSPAHVIRGHQGQPVNLEFAPGSVMLASAGWDNTVRLWDLSRLEPVIGPIENWGLAGYGASLVTRRAESIGIWQQRPAREVTTRVIPGHLGVRAQVAISPATDAGSTPRWIATGGEEGARLWTIGGSIITRITQQETLGVEFLSTPPHGPDRILTLHSDGVRLWRILRDGETVSVAPYGQRAGGRGAGGETGMLWPMAGDSRMAMVDDTTVVVAGPEGLVLIDCNTGELLRTLDPHPGIATAPSVALAGGGGAGNLAFTGNWKGPAGKVRDLDTGETLLEIAAEHVVGCFTPDGSSLVIGAGAHFTCYDTATWRQRWRIDRNNSDSLAGVLACSADGSLLALGRSRFALDLVDPRTGAVIATLDSPDRRALGEVDFSADGNWLAIATTSDLLQIIDLAGIRGELADLGLDWERGEAVSR